MTLADTVKLIDSTATFYRWGMNHETMGWIKGNGWETKITFNEDRAWQLAAEMVAGIEVQPL